MNDKCSMKQSNTKKKDSSFPFCGNVIFAMSCYFMTNGCYSLSISYGISRAWQSEVTAIFVYWVAVSNSIHIILSINDSWLKQQKFVIFLKICLIIHKKIYLGLEGKSHTVHVLISIIDGFVCRFNLSRHTKIKILNFITLEYASPSQKKGPGWLNELDSWIT